jgi:disulfide bond formation protein DsbB
MHFLRNPYILLLYMLLGAAVPLGFALIVQYGFGYPPCHFCMLQRYPYAMVFALLIFTIPGLNYTPWIQLQALFAAIAWLTTSAIGFYHFGIEQGVISYHGECVGGDAATTNLADLKASIEAAPLVSCNQTGWEFLGVSMPFWNGVTGLALALGILYIVRLQRRNP